MYKYLISLVLLGWIASGCGVYQLNPSSEAHSATSSLQPTAQKSPPPPATPTEASRATPTPPPTPAGQSGEWDLLFSDDFDGSALDTNKWTTCYWWDDDGCTIISNNELEWYQPDDVLVSNGTLKLRAQERTIEAANGETYDYTSGMISSGRKTSDTSLPPGFSFQYGYAEIRAKIPAGQGLWPAFWLLPASHNSKPEIDVLEILGHEPNTIHMYFHYPIDEEESDSTGESWTGPDFSAGWHTFAVDWHPDAITWYVDGVERRRYSEITHIPATPMYLLANLAVGGDWPGEPDSSTPFPSYYEIDYMRVWQRADQTYLTSVADTSVDSSSPSGNFGSDDTLYVDGSPAKITYLKFDTTALAGKFIASATLRIKTTTDSGSDSTYTQTVKLVTAHNKMIVILLSFMALPFSE